MKKLLVLLLVSVFALTSCGSEKEYDEQMTAFITKLVSYSTYSEAGIKNIDKYNGVFREYFTQKGYEDFVYCLYPSIYVEFTTKNKVNKTVDIHIKKLKEKKEEGIITVNYEVEYTLKGGKKPITQKDQMEIQLIEEEGVLKIDKFVLLNTSDIIYKMFLSTEIL